MKTMDDTQITIDLTYLNSLTGGNKPFEKILLTATVTDMDKMVTDLQEAWEGRDAKGIRRNAHSLISLSAIAGMHKVEKWSRKLDEGFADGVFHPEFAVMANNIISGWPAAHVQLTAVIEGD